MAVDRSGSATSTTCAVLGVEMFAGSLDAAARTVLTKATSGDGGYVCQCNVHVLTASERMRRLRAALEDAAAVFPDGAPLAWLERRSGLRRAERVAGPDLMGAVVGHGVDVGLRHYLLGSTPDVLGALERNLIASYPGVSIVGTLAPRMCPWDSTYDKGLVASIRRTRPDIVWCGLGAPRQELWISEHARLVAPALLIGVGAAFDFIAGTKRRAPTWVQSAGLEWAHRLVAEPNRLWRRYLVQNLLFARLLIRYSMTAGGCVVERRVGASA
jgi:N-acetylglucosaminyldiphosphoundecaprenol N-acetyl-beta-D-mannosaminyltransferase